MSEICRLIAAAACSQPQCMELIYGTKLWMALATSRILFIKRRARRHTLAADEIWEIYSDYKGKSQGRNFVFWLMCMHAAPAHWKSRRIWPCTLTFFNPTPLRHWPLNCSSLAIRISNELGYEANYTAKKSQSTCFLNLTPFPLSALKMCPTLFFSSNWGLGAVRKESTVWTEPSACCRIRSNVFLNAKHTHRERARRSTTSWWPAGRPLAFVILANWVSKTAADKAVAAGTNLDARACLRCRERPKSRLCSKCRLDTSNDLSGLWTI